MRAQNIRGEGHQPASDIPRRLYAVPDEMRSVWLQALTDRHIENQEEALRRIEAIGIPPIYVEGENPRTPDDYLNAIGDVNRFLDSMEARKNEE